MHKCWRGGASRVLLVVASLILTAVALEAVLRLSLREEEVNRNYWGKGAFEEFPGAGYRHAEGFEGFDYRRGVFGASAAISKYGLRQPDLEKQLAYAERVLILGDSFAFGLGVEETETFPRRLAERFNPLGVGVVNGAQTGYSATQETIFGTWLARKIRPTAILQFLYLANDVPHDYRRSHENIDVVYGYRLRKDRWPRVAVVDFARTHSYLWMNLGGRLSFLLARRDWRALRKQTRSDPAAYSQNTIRTVLGLRRDSLDNGIRFAVVLIPTGGVALGSGAGRRTHFTEPVVNALERCVVPILDLGEHTFDADDLLTPDEHWSGAGHLRVAESVAPFLEDLLAREVDRSAAREVGCRCREEESGAGVPSLDGRDRF